MTTFFVIGTARSGTNWVGELMATHPDIETTIEEKRVFGWVRQMALDPSTKRTHLPLLVATYRWRALQARPKHYADKSHPNIWLADDLAARLDGARFVGIERSPFATVASMLQHQRVLAWTTDWRRFPIPNRFLGITADMSSHYDDLSPSARCALRWSSHHHQMTRLADTLGDKLIVLRYEDLIDRHHDEMRRLWTFLDVRPIPVKLDVKTVSRDRWKEQLDDHQINDIRSVTGMDPERWDATARQSRLEAS